MSCPRILIDEAIYGEMEAEAVRSYPLETGGALLGYRATVDESLLQVTAQTGPGKNAKHKKHRFEPDGEWQQRKISKAYRESGRITTYLGDWHSHPGGSSSPSWTDRATSSKVARSLEGRMPDPLTVILFGGPEDWDIAVFQRGRWRLKRIEIAFN